MNIFIFRRDYRLDDNISLINSVKDEKILPIFIFTPEQINNNIYKSDNAIQFIVESLKDLNSQLKKYNSKLHVFYGDNLEVLDKINSNTKINKIFFNKDYSKYAKKRDKDIGKQYQTEVYEDYLLHNMGSLLKKDGSMYKVFTPFFNNSKKYIVENPNKFNFDQSMFLKKKFSFEVNLNSIGNFYKHNKNIFIKGGRKEALQRLNTINLSNYNNDRNIPIKQTSYLSAYIKFGCLSIREVYHTFKQKYNLDNQIFSQLYWREFYYYVINYNPDILTKPFNNKFNNIKWNNNNNYFEAWKNGKTGFPFIDAFMRQLNETGYMPNRGRLLVSNFLIKLLLIDWKKGEQYFAQKLIDYDPAVNNGNWQWVSGTGVDYQPSFRILNPWSQIQKYDSNCEYIKKWVPELKDISNKEIINWYKHFQNYNVYLEPIINYDESRKKALKIYSNKE